MKNNFRKGAYNIMNFIRERKRKEHKEFRREFTLIGEIEGNGYSFPCLQDGSPDTNDEHYDSWKTNFERCINSPEKYKDEGLVIVKRTYIEPAIIQCSCGNNVELIDRYLGACSCNKCGQWYNIYGQKLIDADLWNGLPDF